MSEPLPMEREGRLMAPFEHFWSKVRKTEGCWLWEGNQCGSGYGEYWLMGRSVLVHRFSYSMMFGSIPRNQFVMHRCDTPLCVNPHHLVAGTNRENIADRTAKGRSANGENNGRAKLRADQVREIRACLDTGATTTALAARYGVGPGIIGLIKRRLAWKALEA